jgi:hypothetical protein
MARLLGGAQGLTIPLLRLRDLLGGSLHVGEPLLGPRRATPTGARGARAGDRAERGQQRRRIERQDRHEDLE